jgi:hypothetical protein
MRRPNLEDDRVQQDPLMRWVAAGLELAERAGAAYALADDEFNSAAADNAALLVSLAVFIARKSPDLHVLVRSVAFTDGEPGIACGVPLGRYLVGDALRTVVLAPPKAREASSAADPSAVDTVFEDGLSPPPARRMTRARFSAIYLGLCKLLERAAADILQPFSFFAAASPHPMLEQARAAVRHAQQSGGATEADWSLPPPAPGPRPTARRQSKQPLGRCCFCKKPVDPEADYVVRRRSKRARTRPVHSACVARERLDLVLEQIIHSMLGDLCPGYSTRVRGGWLSLLHGHSVLRRWGRVTEGKLEAVIQELRNHVDVHRVMTS